MHFIGIDIGSTSAKVAVYDKNQEKFIDFFQIPTGFSGAKVCEEILQKLQNYENKFIVATGYGRISAKFANKTISEILAHSLGVMHFFDKNLTIIDIGGQDIKAIKIENGKVVDFSMNDKCSAGTGKFIDVMALRLGIDTKELCELALNSDEVAKLSSTCTVFAESEIVSLIAKNTPKERICAGILDSIALKAKSIALKHRSENYFLSGGLSKQKAFIKILSNKLESEILTHENALFCGAMGASLIGVKNG